MVYRLGKLGDVGNTTPSICGAAGGVDLVGEIKSVKSNGVSHSRLESVAQNQARLTADVAFRVIEEYPHCPSFLSSTGNPMALILVFPEPRNLFGRSRESRLSTLLVRLRVTWMARLTPA